MFSLSSFTLAMTMAYLRLNPFQHKEQINNLAREKLRSLSYSGDPTTAYIRELKYLAGEACFRGKKGCKPVPSAPLVLIKILDRILSNIAAVLAFGWLIVVATYQFGDNRLLVSAYALFGEDSLDRWALGTLLSSLILVLVMARFGSVFVLWTTKRIEKLDKEIGKWIGKKADAASPPPKSDGGSR